MTDPAIEYANNVINNIIPAGKFIHLACNRFLVDITSPKWDYKPELAERVIRFCELLENIKGPEAGHKLQLMDWQKFIIYNLYGFVEKGSSIRRFRQAVIFVPRGNGKSSCMAPIALYSTFAENEGGAEGICAAVSRDQARLVWETAKNMVMRNKDLSSGLGIQVGAHAIFQQASASKLFAISSDAKSLEGLNVHWAVLDEIASHPTSFVYDSILTACGKRKNPLLISISTATGNTSGIGRQMWDYAARVLNDTQEDDRLFAVLYTIDDGDDAWNENTWIKANPGWGNTVKPDAIRAIFNQARNNPAQEQAVLTRHLNVWQGADEALFSTRSWNLCADPSLSIDEYEGQECEIAVDLASKTDLASVSITFPSVDSDGRNIYTTFNRCYLNEAAVMEARNPSYPGWAKDGYLILTSGNETDFQTIQSDIIDLCKHYSVRGISLDPWNAVQMMQHFTTEGLPVIEFRMNVQSLSEPTKELGAAMAAGRIVHDGNPVVAFCVGNTVGHFDARQNVYPRRPRIEAKIDCAITLIMTIGRCMVYQAEIGGDMITFI